MHCIMEDNILYVKFYVLQLLCHKTATKDIVFPSCEAYIMSVEKYMTV